MYPSLEIYWKILCSKRRRKKMLGMRNQGRLERRVRKEMSGWGPHGRPATFSSKCRQKAPDSESEKLLVVERNY
jgi:hypothetical protein